VTLVPGHPASLGLLTPVIAICDNVFGLSNREAVGVEEIGADSARTLSRRRGRLDDGDRRNAAHAPAIRLQRPSDPTFAVGNLEKTKKYQGLLEIAPIGRPLWPLRTCLEPARNLPNAAGGLPATSLEPGHDLPATRRKPAIGRLEPAWNLPEPANPALAAATASTMIHGALHAGNAAKCLRHADYRVFTPPAKRAKSCGLAGAVGDSVGATS
jgi:hypothetical protein